MNSSSFLSDNTNALDESKAVWLGPHLRGKRHGSGGSKRHTVPGESNNNSMEGSEDSRELRRLPSSLDGLLELTVFMQPRTSLTDVVARLSHAFGFGLCTSYAAASGI